MKTRLSELFERLHSSYWFVPAVMAAFALLLSYITTRLEDAVSPGLKRSFWLYTGDAGGAMEVLSVIATATITIASLTFSVTIVALTLAASQYGPRVLYSFMRDRSNQVVLGVFIGVFIYALMVLRTVQGDGATFVPQLAVTTALVLALCGIGALIYFIHHIAEEIQADNLIAAVSRELTGCVKTLLPPAAQEEEYQREAEAARALWDGVQADSDVVCAQGRGFLQAVDIEALQRIAAQQQLVMRVLKRPGEFVIYASALVAIHPAARVDRALADVCNGAFILGARRTLIQDVELPFQQLAEIAIRGLSPGVYDPFTALRCIAWLADGLIQVMERGEPRAVRRDTEGKVRLLLSVPGFASIADASFTELRANGAANTLVMKKLLETLLELYRRARTDAQRRVLSGHAHVVYEAALARAGDETGRNVLAHIYAQLAAAGVVGRMPPRSAAAPPSR